jgi:heme exporter protein B
VSGFLATVVRRDLLLAWRRRGDWLTALFFFVMVASLFPLAVGPDPATLRLIGPGVVWVAAMLASLLSLPALLADDHRDGSLEQLLLTPQPAVLLALGKALAHWLIYGVPLIAISPLLGLQFALPAAANQVLILALLLGTPVLSLFGSIGAALTLGLRNGGVLLTLLILPLYVPVLIFGSGAVDAALTGTSAEPHLSLLGAMLVLALLAAPWLTASALKVSIE